ncbi:hypothetical protein A9404_08070 [Halothiobacillus diazotrophicus]|uniref:Uncharacterized protein n=1 Tax=Halothiobacillus diazotrophicus TaxID=1860122 RepID=A0A191ZHH2_9GAMM|nr:hypothetical protein A9404_08070 [Halothiobacillus diazotrophicus]
MDKQGIKLGEQFLTAHITINGPRLISGFQATRHEFLPSFPPLDVQPNRFQYEAGQRFSLAQNRFGSGTQSTIHTQRR